MWIILFFVLPFAGFSYVMWHVWCLLPVGLPLKWAVVAACAMMLCTTFLNFSHAVDGMPLPLARACYETGNSSVFVLLYAALLSEGELSPEQRAQAAALSAPERRGRGAGAGCAIGPAPPGSKNRYGSRRPGYPPGRLAP